MKPDPARPAAQAVLFDMDGTLLDTLEDIAQAANAVLVQLGCPTHPVADYRLHVGSGIVELMRRILPPELRDDPARLTACVQALKTEYEAGGDRLTRPYPGIQELLRTLGAKGIPLAVVTNKPHSFALAHVQAHFPDLPFASVQGPRQGTPTKPDPTMALAAAAELGVAPDRCVFLGDSSVDMQTAANAGMLPVGALWGFRTREELLAHGAALLLESPLDLLQAVHFNGGGHASA